MQHGKRTPLRGQGKTRGRSEDGGGVSVDLTGGIYHSLKMMAPQHLSINTQANTLVYLFMMSSECGTAKTLERKQALLTLFCSAQRGPRMSAFHKISGLKSRCQTSVLCQGAEGVFLVWQRRGRSALRVCLFAAITVAGTETEPDSTIAALSLALSLCLSLPRLMCTRLSVFMTSTLPVTVEFRIMVFLAIQKCLCVAFQSSQTSSLGEDSYDWNISFT